MQTQQARFGGPVASRGIDRKLASSALAPSKAELEQRRKVLLKPGQQSLVAAEFRSILWGEATDEDSDYRQVLVGTWN